jgi:hypothetical protein
MHHKIISKSGQKEHIDSLEWQIGETDEKLLVNVGLKGLDTLQQNDISDVKLDSPNLGTVEKNRVLDVLLSYFGPRPRQAEDEVEVAGHVGVQTSCQVPRFADPVVVQPSVLASLEIAHKLRQFSLEVVCRWKPRWTGVQSAVCSARTPWDKYQVFFSKLL